MPRVSAIRTIGWTLILTACGAGWHRVEETTPQAFPVRQQVQLWMGDRTRVLHAVVVGADSVSGVPFQLPPTCDSCRVAVPRSTVDSMRLGNIERGAVRGFKVGFLVLGLVSVLLYYSVDHD